MGWFCRILTKWFIEFHCPILHAARTFNLKLLIDREKTEIVYKEKAVFAVCHWTH